ncbi:MAG: hypothetical protein GY950_07745, partial [bacterium]|nr:hypothetical protein [bacterium]
VPVFRQWLPRPGTVQNPGAAAADECGQLYFIDNNTRRLFRYNSHMQHLEQLPCIDMGESSNRETPKRIIKTPLTLWAIYPQHKTIKGFSTENYQVKYLIEFPLDNEEIIDFGAGSAGELYVLVRAGNRAFKILTYDSHARPVERHFQTACLKDPAALAVRVTRKEDIIYIIDNQSNGFFTFAKDGECSGPLGDFSSIHFKPTLITIGENGRIFAAGSPKGEIRQFDPDGSHIGKIVIPGFDGDILSLTAVSETLYVGTSQGIAVFSSRETVTNEEGFYYSPVLDSGILECRWHRLTLDAHLPPRTVLEVFYYASDDAYKTNTIRDCLSDTQKSVQQKFQCIESQTVSWKGPQKNPHDMLFRGAAGRYLWLKIRLTSFDDSARPAVSRMQVYYPRQSYLRYLPAVYQEDPVAGEFLERFLSIFETPFHHLEEDITQIARYFDPGTVPTDFLQWLGIWLNLALEEEWAEDKKRLLIAGAYEIYKRKGTPEALKRIIEIYTGEPPIIQEHAERFTPLVLNRGFRLGVNSVLQQTPVRGFRLGDDSILGRAVLRDEALSPEDPFLRGAFRFTVIFNLPDSRYNRIRHGVKRILDEEKPAYTTYTMRNTGKPYIGLGAYVGINFTVSGYRPPGLDADAVLGTGLVVFDSGEDGGKVGRRSSLDMDLKLI